MQSEVLFSDLLKVLKKNMTLIVVIVLVFLGISFFSTKYMIPLVYQASTQVLVNQREDSKQTVNIGEVQSNIQLVDTYRVIIKSPRILEAVQEENPSFTVKQLNKAIDVTNEANSQVINIIVKDTNPDDAIKVANDTAKIFEKEIGKIMKIDNASVLSEADEESSKDPVSPKLLVNLIVAFVIGLLLSLLIMLIRLAFDKTIKTEKEIEELSDYPVLGSVRNITKKELEKLKSGSDDMEGRNA